MTGMHHTIPLRGLVHELMIPQEDPTPIFTDAAAVLASASGGASLRHTPWLLARTAIVVEATEEKILSVRKIDGKKNPVNSFTKYTAHEENTRDIDFLTNAEAGGADHGLHAPMLSVDDVGRWSDDGAARGALERLFAEL